MSIVPEIHLKYTAPIWKIYTSENKFLLLELRDENTLTTKFDLYNIIERRYQWKNFIPEDPWRVGISYLNNEIFVIHIFGSGNLPTIEKLLVYNTSDAEHINSLEKIHPHLFRKNIMKGADEEGNISFIDLKTGVEVEAENLFSTTDVMNTLSLPLTYTEDSDSFATVKGFVAENSKEEAVGLAEYLEYGNNIFLSYHVKKKRLECFLLGISDKGEIWLKEYIDKSESYITDTFFIWQDYLVFIIEKKEIKAIKLIE